MRQPTFWPRGLMPLMLSLPLLQPAPLAAAELGRLIYTPQERAAILAARRAAQRADAGDSEVGALRLDGILLRPEGAWAWFDGRRYKMGESPVPELGPLVIDPSGVRLGGQRLKPAERLQPGAAEIAHSANSEKTAQALPPAPGASEAPSWQAPRKMTARRQEQDAQRSAGDRLPAR